MDRPKTGYLAEPLTFRAPGPGNYAHDSMFSKQKSSLKQSSENFKFGSSARDDIVKIYTPGIPQEGTARKTPGPGAYTQQDHNKITRGTGKSKAPAWAFAGNLNQVARDGVSDSFSTLPQCGPGSYGAREAIGKQTSSTKKTAARANFGTADRYKSEVAISPGYQGRSKGGVENPGPGTYNAPSSLQKQSDASKESAFAFSFGTSTRDKDVLKEEMAKVPGPGAYVSAPGCGVQANSRYRTSQRTLFGTSARGGLQNPVG